MYFYSFPENENKAFAAGSFAMQNYIVAANTQNTAIFLVI